MQTMQVDMIIRQNQTHSTCPCGDKAQPGPSWPSPPLPTPVLANKGLTSIALNEIIATINRNATQDYRSKYSKNSSSILWLPCIGILIGIIIMVVSMDYDNFIVGMCIFGASGFCFVITAAVNNGKYQRAKQFAMDNVRVYVETELNKVWQAYGIRWSIITEQTITSHRGTGDSRRARIETPTWYNICITSLQSAAYAQPVRVVVIPQQGVAGATEALPPYTNV
eukprot:125869_1